MAEPILPPQSLGAEQALLGCCLLDSSAIARVADVIESSADFYRINHSYVYDAMVALYARHDGIDYITVSEELKRQARFEEVGVDYLMDLAACVPHAGKAVTYARTVADKAMRRRTIEKAERLKQAAYDDSSDLAAAISATTSELLTLQFDERGSRMLSAAELVDAWLSEAKNGPSRLRDANRTRIGALDSVVGGYVDSDLHFWGGGPGSGKTTLAMQSAHLKALHNEPVLVISMELGRKRFVERLIGFETGISSRVMQYGPREKFEAHMPDFVRGVSSMSGMPLFVTFGQRSTRQIAAHAKDVQARLGRKLSLLVIDRVEMLADRDCRGLEETKRIPILTPRVKAIATDLDIPVVCLAQLNRDGRKNAPSMDSFRASGSIEQDGQVCVIICSDKQKSVAQFHVVKQNDGDTNPCPEVLWQHWVPRFLDIDHRHSAAPPAPPAQQPKPVEEELFQPVYEDIPF